MGYSTSSLIKKRLSSGGPGAYFVVSTSSLRAVIFRKVRAELLANHEFGGEGQLDTDEQLSVNSYTILSIYFELCAKLYFLQYQ